MIIPSKRNTLTLNMLLKIKVKYKATTSILLDESDTPATHVAG